MMMNNKRKDGSGCLKFGCMTMVVLLLLLIGGGIYGVYWLKNAAEKYLSDEPATLPVISATDEEIDELNARFEAGVVQFLDGEQVDLSISARDLNVLVASQPGFCNAQGRVYFEMKNERLSVQASIPFEATNVESLNGKWLNGDAQVSVAVADGKLAAYIHQFYVNNEPIPELIMKLLRGKNLLEGAEKEMPIEMRELLHRLESVEIADGKFRIRTQAGADYLSEKPLTIAPATVPTAQAKRLDQRINRFCDSAEAGQSAKLSLTETDVNLLLDVIELADTNVTEALLADAQITDGVVKVRGSLPISVLGLKRADQKFFNVKSDLLLEVVDGAFAGRLRGARVNGHALPAFMQQKEMRTDVFKEVKMAESAYDPKLRRFLTCIQSAQVVGDTLVVEAGNTEGH